MSFNANRAFDVTEGISVKGRAGFYSGSGSPIGYQANLNSVYRDATSLDVWKKVGPLDTDWALQTSSDPFEKALFDDCTPLFDKDAGTNTVQILEECG